VSAVPKENLISPDLGTSCGKFQSFQKPVSTNANIANIISSHAIGERVFTQSRVARDMSAWTGRGSLSQEK
jgi:hypothetical protein